MDFQIKYTRFSSSLIEEQLQCYQPKSFKTQWEVDQKISSIEILHCNKDVSVCMYICKRVWQSVLLAHLNAFRTHPPTLCPAIIYSHPQIPNQFSPLHLYVSSALTQPNPTQLDYQQSSRLPHLHLNSPSLLSLPAALSPFLFHLLSPPAQSAREEAGVLVHQEERKRTGYTKPTDSRALTWNKSSLKEQGQSLACFLRWRRRWQLGSWTGNFFSGGAKIH